MKITISVNTDNPALAHSCKIDCGAKFNITVMRQMIKDIADDCSDFYWHENGTHKIYNAKNEFVGTVTIS